MKKPSNNQVFRIRVRGGSMYPTIQDGDWLIVDPRRNLENNAIVIARVQNEMVCCRLLFKEGHTFLFQDNQDDDSTFGFIEIERKAVIGRVVRIERFLIEDAEILGSVVGSYRSLVDDPSPDDTDNPIGCTT